MLRDQIRLDITKKAISKLKVLGLQFTDKEIEVTRTVDAKFGDFSTNVALKISRQVKQSPLEFARVLAGSLKVLPYVEKLEVAGPGFVNFFIKPDVWQNQVTEVLKAGEKYGANQIGKGKKARVEFVSANPTGPLHFGNARGGPIGDVLASVLELSGWQVLREYYDNNVGEQVRKLGESVANVQKGKKLEEQEYKGQYVVEIAGKIGSFKDANSAGERAIKLLFEGIIKDCREMGINFDRVYHENDLIRSEKTKKTLKKVEKYLKNREEAIWFAPSDEFLQDRETVVIKSDGSYTYFANDIAYHYLKFSEGYDLVIDVMGANHHGHVPRLQAAVKALGFDVKKFQVILYQWVRFINLETLELLTMSKREGTFITAREVLDAVKSDALRFFMLMYDPNSHIDFDLSLAMRKSKDNPVYYVQYAHARVASILRHANSKFEIRNSKLTPNLSLLNSQYELSLIKQITRLPEMVEDIASSFAVHRLTAYATDLADSFHKFYENCRVIGEKEDLMQARIGLILATKITLANTLKLLGISAPEKM